MATLDIAALLTDMVSAAKDVLKTKWPKARDFATNEFTKLLNEAENIARLRTAGIITDEQSSLLMDMQRNASRSVLLTIEGLGLIAAEAAINAALGAVRNAVNQVLGFALL